MSYCCCCYAPTNHILDCNHIMCKDCSLKLISTKWKNGTMCINCPLCRKQLEFSCTLLNEIPIFKYDRDIYFTISNTGVFQNLPDIYYHRSAKWMRPTGPSPRRLHRCSMVHVLPFVFLNFQDRQALECQQ